MIILKDKTDDCVKDRLSIVRKAKRVPMFNQFEDPRTNWPRVQLKQRDLFILCNKVFDIIENNAAIEICRNEFVPEALNQIQKYCSNKGLVSRKPFVVSKIRLSYHNRFKAFVTVCINCSEKHSVYSMSLVQQFDRFIVTDFQIL